MYRTKTCGELKIQNVKETVELARMDTKDKRLRRHDIYRLKRWIWNYPNCSKRWKLTRTSKTTKYWKLYPHFSEKLWKERVKI